MDVWHASNLSVPALQQALGHGLIDRRAMVVFDRASPQARKLLRARKIAYASTAGELFVVLPDLIVDRAATVGETAPRMARDATEISPFARRAARIPRWLLLHPSERPTIGDLADRTDLSRPFASQVAHALADRGLIELHTDPKDKRSRSVRLERPGALAEAWADEWRRRRRREISWDIGTATLAETLASWSQAARHSKRRWMLGGLAGADRFVRAVEPASLLVWIDPADLEEWQRMLLAERVVPGRSVLRVAAAPDPWVLGLAWEDGEISVADYAQLYLDCYSEGERALEAAAAIRQKVGW